MNTESASALDPTPDPVLVLNISRGAAAALEELNRRYSRWIRAEAWRILSDQGEAEDVHQEVLCKVWQHAGSYDPRQGTVATWLLVVARRTAIDRLRRHRRRLRFVAEQPRQANAVQPDFLDREVFHRRLSSVKRAFRALPPEQRQVLGLAVLRDMSQSEIANATGTPLGTVKTRISSARRRLRESLGVAELQPAIWCAGGPASGSAAR